MNRILIFWVKKDIKHIGGPSGYLLPFLNHSFAKFEVYFLDSKTPSNFEIEHNMSIDDFSIIIFHMTIDMYIYKNFFINYRGITLLQSHSPKPPFLELIQDFTYTFKDKIKRRLIRYKLEATDRYSFMNANYLLFPCAEAEEPYYNTWRFFRKNYDYFSKKTKYLLTGIKPQSTCEQKINIRLKYNIPESAILLAFIGRPSKVKGFDTFKKLVKRNSKNCDLYFIHFGSKPNRNFKHAHYIEAGFQNNITEAIEQCDCILCLNKQTYFDLSILEVLSIGKNIIMSNTGGNKKIKQIFGELVEVYSNFKELETAIANLKKNNDDKKERIIEIFTNYFTDELFLDNFESVIESLF